MSKTYLPYEPDQQLLLPAALQEWLPDEHLAYFISDVVDQLDILCERMKDHLRLSQEWDSRFRGNDERRLAASLFYSMNFKDRTLAGCGKYVVLSNAKDLGRGRPASP